MIFSGKPLRTFPDHALKTALAHLARMFEEFDDC